MVFKKKQPKTEGVVVGGKKKLRMPDVKKLKNIDWRSRKTKSSVLIAIVISIALIIGGYLAQQIIIRNKIKNSNDDFKIKAQIVCDNQTHETAAKNITSKNDQLQEVANNIKKKKDYQKDPNCLIPVIVNEIHRSNLSEADALLKQLKMVSKDTYTINQVYKSRGLTSVNDIQLLVDGLRNTIEKKNESIRYF